MSLHFCLVYAFRPVLRFYINATRPGFTQGRVSVMKAIKPSAPIWKAVGLIMSNHFNYNSKLLVMPRHNIGRHLVATSSALFRASVIKWNDPTYQIHFTAKKGKTKMSILLRLSSFLPLTESLNQGSYLHKIVGNDF